MQRRSRSVASVRAEADSTLLPRLGLAGLGIGVALALYFGAVHS